MGAADLDLVLRLLAAAAIGIAIGFNRELRDKPLGMRTLALVALGSAIAPLAAIGFGDVGHWLHRRRRRFAPSRLGNGLFMG